MAGAPYPPAPIRGGGKGFVIHALLRTIWRGLHLASNDFENPDLKTGWEPPVLFPLFPKVFDFSWHLAQG